MSTKDFMIEGRKDRKNNGYFKTARKKILAILAIIMLLMQYMVVPSYSLSQYTDIIQGDFSPGEWPYDIEFVEISNMHSRKDISPTVYFANAVCAIDSNGTLWTWGEDMSYDYNLDYTEITTPKKVSVKDLALETDNLKCISGYATIDKDGLLWVWNNGYYGSNNSEVKEIGNGRKFTTVSSEGNHLLALDEYGNLWVYGENGDYQLGTGDTTGVSDIKTICRGTTFNKISTNMNSSAAIDSDGNLWYWGTETKSVIPYENIKKKPTKISTNIKFKEVSVSGYCGLALDEDGNLYSWGSNFGFTLGNGSTKQSDQISSPEIIMKGTKFKEISAGSGSSLAIDVAGNLYRWGINSGAVSDYQYSPTIFKEGTKFKKVLVGSASCYAIDENGDLWAWGDNRSYTFGDGTNDSSVVPIRITQHRAKYTVNFYDENGTTLLDTQQVASGSEASTSIVPTKNSTVEHSYTFEKWVAMDGSDIDLSHITQDTNVKAKYREDTRSYNVKFVNEDGTTILDEQTVGYGNKATYNGITPSTSKYGYICTFKGWDKDPNSTTITEDTIFTAQYDEEIATYTITYENTDGASFVTENPDTYNVETEDFTLNNPTAAGYVFQGWRGTGIDGMLKTVTVHRGTTGNRTYEAVWTAREDTKYKIEHYKERPDGTYGSTPDEIETKTGVTQSTVTATIKSYPGYTEDRENPNRLVSGTIAGDGSLILRVYYKAKSDTSYRVEHYLQNLDNTNYTIDDEATETKTGKTGNQTTAQAKNYDGFTAQSFSQETISGDGSTVIKIYYNRNRDTGYIVEHYKQNSDGTYPETPSDTERKRGVTGDIVTATAKTYVGYTEDTTNADRVATGVINGDGSLTLKLYYKANTNTLYKVEHYKQKPNGSYPNVADETEEKSGTTGTMATAEPKQYDGYTEDITNGNRIVSGTIYADGSLVLRLYYKANTDTVYKVEHYKQNPDGTYPETANETEEKTGSTGANVVAQAKVYDGYKEDTTNANRVPSGTIAGDGSLILKLYYKASEDTPYKVEHYKQNPDGTYPQRASETENKTGRTGANVTAQAKQYAGYTEDTTNANRVTSGEIAQDGSLILKLYYTANTDTAYKVEHYKQKPDGTYGNVADETEDKTGKTGTTVNATAKEYAGYTEDTTNSKRIESGEIAGDGSLVLKLYYKANTNTSYKVEHYKQKEDGTYPEIADETEEKVGTTGATVNAKAKTYKGYVEDKTNSNRVAKGEIAGDGSLILKLYYMIDTNAGYKVEHYKQKPDGTYGTVADEIEEKIGTIGETVTVVPKEYKGYIEDKENSNKVLSGKVLEDGSLVLKVYYKIHDDGGKHIVVTPSEDEHGKKDIEISSTSPKEIDKVTVNGQEIKKDENGKYIYYPDKNGSYEIVVTYKDGTTEKEIYKETRFNNNLNSSNKNQTSGTQKDNTLATKILSKTGRTYMGIIVLSVVVVMSIIVLTKKYRDNKK